MENCNCKCSCNSNKSKDGQLFGVLPVTTASSSWSLCCRTKLLSTCLVVSVVDGAKTAISATQLCQCCMGSVVQPSGPDVKFSPPSEVQQT
eukprot:3350359-Amphidinium_carterae.1